MASRNMREGVRAAPQEAVRAALVATGPTVIEAVVDAEHYLETICDRRRDITRRRGSTNNPRG